MNSLLWGLQVLLSVAFLAHAWTFLFPPADMVAVMNASIPAAFRLFIGVAEVLAAIGLTLPGLTRIQPWLVPSAAAGLMIVMIGAVLLHVSLFAFGLPIVFFSAYLPEPIQQGVETAVGLMIVALAVRLLLRWRRGTFHPHAHRHVRTPLGSYAIGLVHGVGGSGGVGLLLLAGVQSRVVAVTSLTVLALFTAVSMSIISAGWGLALGRPSVRRSLYSITPAFGLASLVFGVWYSLGALTLVPYLF